jgi:hypothetical protein
MQHCHTQGFYLEIPLLPFATEEEGARKEKMYKQLEFTCTKTVGVTLALNPAGNPLLSFSHLLPGLHTPLSPFLPYFSIPEDTLDTAHHGMTSYTSLLLV